jgi:hypothetical protein
MQERGASMNNYEQQCIQSTKAPLQLQNVAVSLVSH